MTPTPPPDSQVLVGVEHPAAPAVEAVVQVPLALPPGVVAQGARQALSCGWRGGGGEETKLEISFPK